MTKAKLIKELEGLDDDAQIYIGVPDDPSVLMNIAYACDKVTGDKVQNEITLVCE